MENSFYSAFDQTCIPERQADPYRNRFEVDRDRIIHTSAFRRLQAKTQVFQSGEYDFYRTRLTHSIEVAQIGRSICSYLKKSSNSLNDDFYIDPNLVEAICLSHDLGHPPFGHNGERTLNRLMADYGGFEGNAQTLRLLTTTIYSDLKQRKGMQASRALLDGVLKYKSLYSERDKPENHFLYDDQKLFLDFVFEGSNVNQELPTVEDKNNFRSLECQIMNWADDTAYCIHDLADGIRAEFITIDKLRRWAESQQLSDEEISHVGSIVRIIQQGNVDATLGLKIGEFIQASSLIERQNYMSERTNRYRFSLQVEETKLRESELYKRIAFDIVFLSTRVKQLEYKGDRMLERLFRALMENYSSQNKRIMRLVPPKLEKRLKNVHTETEKARLLCDYLAGMTDSFSIKTYRRLFDPGYGSIVDIV
ncbi:MAG: deoxyguanosinetriphosphate triphosphohydrolase [Opitutaceae bacterium]|nr:deoxyguanosinetriphosphate triphosphohydrolase [Opitutaceae bacterium]|tara:strand:+ start:7531 stop:8796 length:1266 start_codon:yes stop_codon:yes gene_type:complete